MAKGLRGGIGECAMECHGSDEHRVAEPLLLIVQPRGDLLQVLSLLRPEGIVDEAITEPFAARTLCPNPGRSLTMPVAEMPRYNAAAA